MKKKIFLVILIIIDSQIYSQNKKNNETVVDISGNVYNTITIGTQTWMAENLRYKAPSGCWAYKDDEANVNLYGYLYNWTTANNVCPIGWSLPTNYDWLVLAESLGGLKYAGAAMKSKKYWLPPNQGVYSENSFSAYPSGTRNKYGGYYYLGEWAVYWTSSMNFDNEGCHNTVVLMYDQSCLMPLFDQNEYGNAVRCIKNKLIKF